MFRGAKPTVFIIDGDAAVRDSLGMLMECHGFVARLYVSAAAFLSEPHPEPNSCLVVDGDLDGLNGLDLLAELHRRGVLTPAIVTSSGKMTECLRSAVARIGAVLLEKPYAPAALIAHVRRALN